MYKLPARRIVLALSLVVPLAAILIWDLSPYLEYHGNITRLRQAIPIGSNMDDVPAILEQQGFRFVDKHFATVAEDRYWIDVRVAWKSRPWTLRLLCLVGIDVYYQWAVIEADLDGRITAVRG